MSSESIEALMSDTDDVVLFLNNAGEAIAVDPRIKEGGASLVEIGRASCRERVS